MYISAVDFSRTIFTTYLTLEAGFLTYPEPTVDLPFVLGLLALHAA